MANIRMVNIQAGRRAEDGMQWLLLLLPLVLAASNPNWLYSAAGSIDTFVYTGFFRHLATFKATLFPDTYYGSRLPWLLPGYLAHHFLTARLANYVLHFTFYYAATFSFYYLLKRGFGKRNALLGTILFGAHPAFLAAIGWDYVDGAGIAYNLVCLACIARAADSRRRRLWLVLAGVAAAAMVYTNLFLVIYLPFPLVFFLLLSTRGARTLACRVETPLDARSACTSPQSDRRRSPVAQALPPALLYVGAGAALLTVVLGAINSALDGHFWFYAPSIRTFVNLSTNGNPWRKDWQSWAPNAYWLGVPAAAAFASLVSLLLGSRDEPSPARAYKRFLVSQYLAAFALMVAWQVAGGVGFQLVYYTSYLLPSLFLAIGGMIAFPVEEWRPREYWCLAAGTLALFAFSLWAIGTAPTMVFRHASVGAMAVVAAIGLTIRAVFHRRWQSIVAALVGLWVYQFVFPMQERSQPTSYAWDRIIQGADSAWPYFEKRQSFFWYDGKEPFGDEFASIASNYLWGFSYIGYQFPEVTVPDHLRADSTAILLSKSDRAVQTAESVINKRLLIDSVRTSTVAEAGVSYNLTFFDLEGLNGEAISLESEGKTSAMVASKPGEAGEFPSSGWEAARMERRPDGILVTAPDRPYAYGSWYGPLVAKRSGTYRFILRYKLLSGGIRWGGMTADSSKDLGHANILPGSTGQQTATYTVKLGAGEAIVLVIANDPHGQDGAASYLIQSLRGVGVF